MSLFDQIANKVSAGMISRVPSLGTLKGGISGALVGKFVPKKLQGTVNRALRGDIGGAVADGLGNGLSGSAAAKLGKLRLLGGISLKEAERIAAEVQSTNYSKKNLWFLEIVEATGSETPGYEDISRAFNMFATDVSYSDESIASEGKAVGMSAIDLINGIERTEMRITTYDDARGTIRGWFDARRARVAHKDGTLGVPREYLVKIFVSQSATDETGAALFGSFKRVFVVRPTSIEHELSRTEDGLQQIQMTFSQFDTFMYQDS
jgi:hypothetical protein